MVKSFTINFLWKPFVQFVLRFCWCLGLTAFSAVFFILPLHIDDERLSKEWFVYGKIFCCPPFGLCRRFDVDLRCLGGFRQIFHCLRIVGCRFFGYVGGGLQFQLGRQQRKIITKKRIMPLLGEVDKPTARTKKVRAVGLILYINNKERRTKYILYYCLIAF